MAKKQSNFDRALENLKKNVRMVRDVRPVCRIGAVARMGYEAVPWSVVEYELGSLFSLEESKKYRKNKKSSADLALESANKLVKDKFSFLSKGSKRKKRGA